MGIHELTIPVVGLIPRSMTLYYSILLNIKENMG